MIHISDNEKSRLRRIWTLFFGIQLLGTLVVFFYVLDIPSKSLIRFISINLLPILIDSFLYTAIVFFVYKLKINDFAFNHYYETIILGLLWLIITTLSYYCKSGDIEWSLNWFGILLTVLPCLLIVQGIWIMFIRFLNRFIDI